MKMKHLWILVCFFVVCLIVSRSANPVAGADQMWTGNVDSDFLNDGNWDTGAPTSATDLAVIDGGSNLPVVIGQAAGTINMGGFQLGTTGDAAGNVVQNGGTLIVAGTDLSNAPTSFEFKSHIGDQGSGASSWIMNNDATILYDGPLDGDGNGLGTDGINSFDLEIGAQSGAAEGLGFLELHDNAVLRISDDLKIGAEDVGNGIVRVDGNATITAGSGISVSESGGSKGQLFVSQDALVVSGNSAGPGDVIDGRTNEGYLTLSVSSDATADVTVSDNARLYARTLQQRGGITNMAIEGNGQFHVFEVFSFAEPAIGSATVRGSAFANERTSHLSARADAETTIILRDNATMTVDSDIPDSEWSGLALSGGTNQGGNESGGRTLIEVLDTATLTIFPDLNMTLGFDAFAESTLKIHGPDASVAVIGDLRMALDGAGDQNPGTATLYSVITDSRHTTIQVGGNVNIDNGHLVVELDNYLPTGGETYTLVSAGSIIGDAFLSTDFSLAELPPELAWDIEVVGSEVLLKVLGGSLSGDFNNDRLLDIADIDLLGKEIIAGSNDVKFDLNGDEIVDLADQAKWLDDAAIVNGFTESYLNGDANLDGTVNATDLNALGINWQQTVDPWSQGDFNADGIVNAADLNVLAINWQKSIPMAAQAVPEPAAFLLWGQFLAAGSLLRSLRRRKQRGS